MSVSKAKKQKLAVSMRTRPLKVAKSHSQLIRLCLHGTGDGSTKMSLGDGILNMTLRSQLGKADRVFSHVAYLLGDQDSGGGQIKAD